LLNYKYREFAGEYSKYEYDAHGNRIKRIHPGWMMIERRIVYYE
jgi:hypothetical protein